MSYSLELLPDEPILIGTLFESFRLKDELELYLNEATAIIESLEQPVYYIADFSAAKVRIFQDFLVANNRVTRGEGALLHSPNLIETIVVSDSNLLKLATKGLNSATFGNLSVPVFDTLDEALAHVRSLIRQR